MVPRDNLYQRPVERVHWRSRYRATHLAIELSRCEGHPNPAAGVDIGRPAEDAAVGGPADGVAAAQHGERAERGQTAGACTEMRLGAMVRARRRRTQTAVRCDQPCAYASEPAARIE